MLYSIVIICSIDRLAGVSSGQYDVELYVFFLIYVTCIMHSFAHSYFPSILIPPTPTLSSTSSRIHCGNPICFPSWLLPQASSTVESKLRADWLVGVVLWQCG